MALDHLAVQYRAVALVEVKAVLGILFVECQHEPIPRNFRNDGSRRNDRYFFVALDDGLLWNARGQYEPPVQKNHG